MLSFNLLFHQNTKAIWGLFLYKINKAFALFGLMKLNNYGEKR